MRNNYLNLAIEATCPKRNNCFPKGKHNCVQCHADQEADRSESECLDMIARNEKSEMTEW